MNTPPNKLFYEFGAFRLDSEKHRLLRHGEIVPLTPKSAETLRVLVERSGQLVEREDLMNSIWGDVAVEEGNLTVTISMLRKALGEDTNGRSFIETVPRRGYKFVADVRKVFETVPALIVEKQTVGRVIIDEEFRLGKHSLTRLASSLFSSSRRRLATATVMVVAGILGIGTFVYSTRSGRALGRTVGVKSIAVLPFRVISSPTESAHQGLSLADVLITRQSNIREINVRPTSAVMSFENSQESSAIIGQKLLVDAVLEGSILQMNDQVRVTARLIKVGDQSPIWAGQFEKPASNQMQLQDEIALQVVDALALTLTGKEEKALTRRYTENADSYQLYLKGRYHWNKRSYGGLAEAEHLFRTAIEKDPKFALAYVGLADSLIFAQDTIESNAALAKALELDPDLAEAWATRGFQLTVHKWLWSDAEEAFKKSIELNPGYATAHHWFATLLEIEGRHEYAKAELHRALEIDPLSYNFLADLGQVYYFNHEYSQAKEFCNKALSINPTFTYAHQYLYLIDLQTGDYETALEELVKAEIYQAATAHEAEAPEASGDGNLRLFKGAYDKGGIRKFYEYQLSLTTDTNASMSNPNRWYSDAGYHALLGNKEKALDCLERAFEARSFTMAWAKAEPIFDSLRSEPRFKAILKKMNLPPDNA